MERPAAVQTDEQTQQSTASSKESEVVTVGVPSPGVRFRCHREWGCTRCRVYHSESAPFPRSRLTHRHSRVSKGHPCRRCQARARPRPRLRVLCSLGRHFSNIPSVRMTGVHLAPPRLSRPANARGRRSTQYRRYVSCIALLSHCPKKSHSKVSDPHSRCCASPLDLGRFCSA